MRSTKKEVVLKIQQHVLKQIENIQELKDNIKALQWGNQSTISATRTYVENGGFLIYYWEVKEFINGLGINPDNKEYEDQKSWELYINLLSREILKMIK